VTLLNSLNPLARPFAQTPGSHGLMAAR